MREPGRDSVVFLGRSVMDEYYRTDHFPAEGEKIPLTPLTTVPGGFSNSAFVLAALGTEVFMAETLGDDVHTDTHRRLMEQAGIRQDFVRIRPGAKNNKALILCSEKSSEKTVFLFRTDPEPMEYTREELSRMAQAGWIFANLSDVKKQRDPQGFTASLLASGARLAIDGEPSTFESPEAENFWFSRCSFLSLNDFAFAKFCRKDPRAVERLVRGHPDRTVVHTMGEAGCTVYRSDGRWFCPACPVQAVDTTGAGDTFNAAYLHMHRKGNDPAACAAFACAAAAKSTLTRSPRAGAVGEGAVLAFMEQMRYSPRILREKL